MLEDLERIGWDRLGHAYGVASDVPEMLRSLASEDEEQSEAALDELFGSICHQGTVYEATAPAVPLLVELAQSALVHHRDDIVFLLGEIARRAPDLDTWLTGHDLPQEPRSEDEAARLDRELRWARAAHEAVAAAIPVLLGLLDDPDPDVPEMVLHTLAAFPERARTLVPELRQRVARQTDPSAVARLLVTVGSLAVSLPEAEAAAVASWLHAGLAGRQGGPARPAAAAAAVALARCTPVARALPDAVPDTLKQILREEDADAGAQPWPLSSIWELLHEALCERPDDAVELIVGVLDAPRAATRSGAAWLADCVMRDWRHTPQRLVPSLARLLDDPDLSLRCATARKLAGMGRAVRLAADDLAAALQDRSYGGGPDDPQREVAHWALLALARIQDRRCLPALREELERERPPDSAAQAFQTMGAAAAELVPVVRRRLLDLPVPANRSLSAPRPRLVLGLGAIGQAAAAAVPEVLLCLERGWGEWAAASTLGRLGPAARSAEPALRRALDHADADVRASAAWALWRVTGQVEATLSVFAAMLDGGPETAATAAELLAELGPAAGRLAPKLSPLLGYGHRDPRTAAWVRVRAARALWRLDGQTQTVLPVLLAELVPTSEGLLAAECLGEIGPAAAQAVPTLEQFVHGLRRLVHGGTAEEIVWHDETYQDVAALALARIRRPTPAPAPPP